ncbi:hypothetical protein SDC9_11382 [bioreactor metagenome]|uniref:Uncharacterized protein n=1 Tax=bioreactor metagenome TaxID=1076179 RepID=A0A644TFI8_9ZZZZ|nr:hypothetical protein [Negativicutes bacterium]
MTDETLGTVQELDRRISDLENNLIDVDEKIDALLENFKIENPRLIRVRKSAYRYIEEEYRKNKSVTDQQVFDMLKDFFYVDHELLKRWCSEKLTEIRGCKKE